jgi:hypothetical protein
VGGNLGICCHPKGQKYAYYEFHATSEQYQFAAVGRSQRPITDTFARDEAGNLIQAETTSPPNAQLLAKLLSSLVPGYQEKVDVSVAHAGHVWIEGQADAPKALPAPSADFAQTFGLTARPDDVKQRPANVLAVPRPCVDSAEFDSQFRKKLLREVVLFRDSDNKLLPPLVDDVVIAGSVQHRAFMDAHIEVQAVRNRSSLRHSPALSGIPSGAGPCIVDENGERRRWIAMSYDDNAILRRSDPKYMATIEQSCEGDPPRLQSWRYGNFDIVSGGALDDVFFKYGKFIYVEPFEIPATWRTFASYDHGSTRPYAWLAWAESDGTDLAFKNGRVMSTRPGDLFLVGEVYGNINGEPDKGTHESIGEITARVQQYKIKWAGASRMCCSPTDGTTCSNAASPTRRSGKRTTSSVSRMNFASRC